MAPVVRPCRCAKLAAMVSMADLLTDWRFDPASLLIVVVMAGGWVVLLRRHPRWPAGRSVLFAAALGTGVLATQSGIGAHDTTSLTAHVAQHLLLGMVAPFLAARAAPLTLVLQAAKPSTRLVVRRALRRPIVATLTRPVVAFVAFGVTIVALLFTPLLELTARSDVAHVLAHFHLVAVGCLFLWPLVGVDVLPHRPSHGARMLLVVAAVPFHAFVGMAMLTASSPLSETYPSLDDQRRAAGLLWASGELLTVTVAAVVFASWYSADQRAARRADRRRVSLGPVPPA